MKYGEVVEREGIRWCSECSIGNHQRGWSNPSRATVHWTDRRVNKLGLRRFLMLVGAIRHSHNRGQPPWQRLYEQNVYAYQRGLSEYHVRFPARFSASDRARVRYSMGKSGVVSDPDKRSIARWAQERD